MPASSAPVAERIASAIFDAISDNVATKQDIAAVNARIDLVRTDLALVEHRLLTRLRVDRGRADALVRGAALLASRP